MDYRHRLDGTAWAVGDGRIYSGHGNRGMESEMKIDITYGKIDLEVRYDVPEGMSASKGFELLDIKHKGESIHDFLSDKAVEEIMDKAIEVLDER